MPPSPPPDANRSSCTGCHWTTALRNQIALRNHSPLRQHRSRSKRTFNGLAMCPKGLDLLHGAEVKQLDLGQTQHQGNAMQCNACSKEDRSPIRPRFALSNQRVARGGEQPVAVAMPLEIQDPILVQLPSNATSASQRPLLCKNAVADNSNKDKLKPQGRLQDRAVLQPSQ